ncbi:MFS transporter [Oceanobacillus sp. 1P07AA]|uniref:MFS transporter n=1 Tax=Oceanobacillus sp. 1P07AA TaxID=3132293 RepID=UPI0039A6949F
MGQQKFYLLIHNKAFLRLFTSYSVSMFGRWLDMVAVMILFGYIWNSSPLVIAFIPIAYALPHALFSQFAGVLADRFNKVKLMIFSDVSVSILSVILLFVSSPTFGLILLFLRSTFTIVHFPSQQSLVKEIVEEKYIVKAITLNGMINEVTKLIGPILGGALASFFSPKICILINAIAYFISAIIVWKLREKVGQEKTESANQEKRQGLWLNLKEGWKYVFLSRVLLISISYSIIGYLAIQMTDVQLTVLLREFSIGKPELLGWVMASSGFGALVSMMLVNYTLKRIDYRFLLGGSYLCIGIGYGGMGYLSVGISSFVPILLGFIIGLGVGFYSIGINYILQKETTRANISRVSGIYNSLTNAIILIAPILGGILIEVWNIQIVFKVTGLLLLVCSSTFIMITREQWHNKKRKTG